MIFLIYKKLCCRPINKEINRSEIMKVFKGVQN